MKKAPLVAQRPRKQQTIVKELAIFRNEIENIYGYSLQVDAAISQWHKFLQHLLSRTKATNTLFFGRDDPNSLDSAHQYRRTFGELIIESHKNGKTSNIHRRSVLVLLVASWEDHHRAKIAAECGLDGKNELRSDLFHDLNRYRQAILHAGARLHDEPKVIGLFRRGDRVALKDD